MHNVLHIKSTSVSQTKAKHMWNPKACCGYITSGRWRRWVGWYSATICTLYSFFFPRPSELSELTIPLQQLHCTIYCTSRAHLYHKQRQHTCGLWNPKTCCGYITSGRWRRWWVGWYSAAISCASPAGEVSDDATCLEQCSAGNEFPGCHNQMYLRWRKWTTPRVGEFWEWFLLMGRDISFP